MADRCRHDNAQADFGDASCGDVKSAPGIERARDADYRRGVSGKDKGVGAKFLAYCEPKVQSPIQRRDRRERARAPGRRGRLERAPRQRDHCPDNAIKALRQDLPALLRLRDDETVRSAQ